MPTSFLVSLLLPYPTSTHPISAYPTQRRYRIALPILLNTYCAISDNTHIPSEVSTEPDLSFDESTTFELCGTSRMV